jgi:hypothetical protein
MEKVLGRGPIEAGRKIPGSRELEGVEFRYVAEDGKGPFPELFGRVLKSAVPRRARSGGVAVEGCRIRPPGGVFFHAIAYRGDIEGIRSDIEQGAQALNVQTARIAGDKFVLRDGSEHALTDCQVEFY